MKCYFSNESRSHDKEVSSYLYQQFLHMAMLTMVALCRRFELCSHCFVIMATCLKAVKNSGSIILSRRIVFSLYYSILSLGTSINLLQHAIEK